MDRLIDKKKNIGYNSSQIKHTKILGIKTEVINHDGNI